MGNVRHIDTSDLDLLKLFYNDAKRVTNYNPDPTDKHQLICSCLFRVTGAVQKYKHCGIPLIDLIQAGMEGLIYASVSFDPSLGFKFATHAERPIHWEIIRYIKGYYRLKRNEISFETPIICDIVNPVTPVTFNDVLPHPGPSPEDEAESMSAPERLNGLLCQLTPRQEWMIRQRRLSEKSTREMAKVLGITPQAIDIAEKKAMGKLMKKAGRCGDIQVPPAPRAKLQVDPRGKKKAQTT